KYRAMALRNARFIAGLDRRPDGLYRHSPLSEAAWGRGNGFPAFGLTLALDEMARDAPEYRELAAMLQAHLTALLPCQDATGMWHEVIDHPESYREFSATALIAYAMRRGIVSGWLDRARFEGPVERAWNAVRARIGDDGGVIDVCTSTGKMNSLREYLDR